MNRIELYVDRENKLTLDFYYNINDDYPISQFKGEKCYSVISKLCENSIVNIKENSEFEEISLTFNECILHVSEYDKVFQKRGTSPIKACLAKYYDTENAETFQPKKVSRINKNIGKQIIAGALVLGVLGSLIGVELSRKKKNDNVTPNESTTYMEETTTSTDSKTPTENVGFPDDSTENTVQEQDPTIDNLTDINNELLEENSDMKIFIPFEDRSSTEKARITKAYYGETIEKYANKYGVDPKIVIAIATQERGIHSDEMDRGGATGLMQLQNAVWIGENITAYNYELERYETVAIDKSKLSDVFYNIKIGCMYFQNCINYMDGNIIAAIQCYNYGYGNMEKVLKQYSFESGKNIKGILSDISDCGWMDCRTEAVGNVGDKNYIEHVISWIGPTINLKNPISSNETVDIVVTNSNPQKTR